MQQWQHDITDAIVDPTEIANRFGIDNETARTVSERFPVRIGRYYAGLIAQSDDPIWRQCVPTINELSDDNPITDPLAEEAHSPVPGLVHRYTDRALLLTGTDCATYCRFCTRKRHVGHVGCGRMTPDLDAAITYIGEHPEIRDVLISGGDPLMLDDDRLENLLNRLSRIDHVEMIRIGSRMAVTLPSRITEQLCRMLGQFDNIYINTHFNHPKEITEASATACRMLHHAGIPLGNQTVLLNGVNDSVETMIELNRKLLKIRVRPYYLHQMDLTCGTGHFRTPLQTGIDIVKSMQDRITGMAIPRYVIDTPGGHGKVPLPSDQVRLTQGKAVITCADGRQIDYPDIIDNIDGSRKLRAV